MRKYIVLLLTILIFTLGNLCAQAQFDNSSLIVVMKPSNGALRLFSHTSVFDGLGIAETELIGTGYSRSISLFSVSEDKQMYKLTLEEAGEDKVLETIDKLNEMPEVEYAQPNFIYQLYAAPNDTEYKNGNQYALDKVNAPSVWDMNISCENITVAVMDSGVKTNHTDLSANIWKNPDETVNGIDDDGNGLVDDIHGWDFIGKDKDPDDPIGHGTHVAGIVSAVTNNGKGVASLARNAKIVPLKIFDNNGNADSVSVLNAVSYVKAKNISIVNLSFGGTAGETQAEKNFDRAFYEAIAQCENTLFVASAGNNANNNDKNVIYPASFELPNIIVIASTDEKDELSSFSNYGAQSVDIAAPGSGIYSTFNSSGKLKVDAASSDKNYAAISGTSQAAPLVASAAALIKAKYPDLTPAEIISRIEDSVSPVASLDGKVKTGGMLDAYAALATPSPSPTPTPTPSPTPSPTPTPSPSPSVTPTDSPEPVITENKVKTERDGNTIHISLEFVDAADENDIVLFAALKRDGVLQRVFMPKVENMQTDITIPSDMANAEIVIYVWHRNFRPYLDPTIVE